MSIGFIVAIGVVLVVATLGFVFWPLIKDRSEGSVAYSLWALVIVFPLAVAGIFAEVTTYPWGEPVPEPPRAAAQTDQAMPAIEEMLAGLAQRLEAEPDDLEGWIMLGRSYMELKQFPQAVEAYREAWRLSEGSRVDVAVNFAEALVMDDPKTLRAGAGDLLDAVLAENPGNTKALWYGGMAAVARGENQVAEQRWARLLEDPNVPDNARRVVQEQLAAMGANVDSAGTSADGQQGQRPAGQAPAGIRLNIELADEFADRVQPGQSLFVFAREAEGAGPPAAVKRLMVDSFPIRVSLSDRDVMMPGRKLSDIKNLRIVARISQGGTAIEAPGDFYGELFPETMDDGAAGLILRIDSQVQ